MKIADLALHFREAFGLPTHYKMGPLESIDPMLEVLRAREVSTASINYSSRGTHDGATVLKLQITTGSGKNRVGRKIWFNREQQAVYDHTDSLHLPGQTSTFKGNDPWRDTNDYRE